MLEVQDCDINIVSLEARELKMGIIIQVIKVVLYSLGTLMLLPALTLVAILPFAENDTSDICNLSAVETTYGDNSQEYMNCFDAIAQSQIAAPTIFIIAAIVAIVATCFIVVAYKIGKSQQSEAG